MASLVGKKASRMKSILIFCLFIFSSDIAEAQDVQSGTPPENWRRESIPGIDYWKFWSIVRWKGAEIENILHVLTYPSNQNAFEERRTVDEYAARIEAGAQVLLDDPFIDFYIEFRNLPAHVREYNFDNRTLSFTFQSDFPISDFTNGPRVRVQASEDIGSEGYFRIYIEDAAVAERIYNLASSVGARVSLKCGFSKIYELIRPNYLICYTFDITLESNSGEFISHAGWNTSTEEFLFRYGW